MTTTVAPSLVKTFGLGFSTPADRASINGGTIPFVSRHKWLV